MTTPLEITSSPFSCNHEGNGPHSHLIISDNIYFRHGLRSVLKDISWPNLNIRRDVNYYLVDLTSCSLRLLVDRQWMNHFPDGAHLILFPDARMLPLANYWFYHASPTVNIRAIIYDRSNPSVHEKLSYALSGREIHPESNSNVLTEHEYLILKKMVKDCLCIQKIAAITQRNTKAVYAQKKRLERKLGVTIKKMLSI